MIYHIHNNHTREKCGQFFHAVREEPIIERMAREELRKNGYGSSKAQTYIVTRQMHHSAATSEIVTFNMGMCL